MNICYMLHESTQINEKNVIFRFGFCYLVALLRYEVWGPEQSGGCGENCILLSSVTRRCRRRCLQDALGSPFWVHGVLGPLWLQQGCRESWVQESWGLFLGTAQAGTAQTGTGEPRPSLRFKRVRVKLRWLRPRCGNPGLTLPAQAFGSCCGLFPCGL